MSKKLLKIKKYFESNNHLSSCAVADHAGILRQRMSDFINDRRAPTQEQIDAINRSIEELTEKQSKSKVK